MDKLMNNTKTIIAVILGLLAVIVIVQNTATVETNILWITISMPRAVLLAVTFALGALSGILFSMRRSKQVSNRPSE
jgi:uncharacterized integral membrane protein